MKYIIEVNILEPDKDPTFGLKIFCLNFSLGSRLRCCDVVWVRCVLDVLFVCLIDSYVPSTIFQLKQGRVFLG